MIITNILTDLEAKAERAKIADSHLHYWDGTLHTWIPACSPNRILALVAYVRKLERVARAARKWTTNFSDRELEAAFAALAGHLDAGEEKK